MPKYFLCPWGIFLNTFLKNHYILEIHPIIVANIKTIEYQTSSILSQNQIPNKNKLYYVILLITFSRIFIISAWQFSGPFCLFFGAFLINSSVKFISSNGSNGV